MSNVPFDCRYSKILEKNPREIVLLRGNGCKWRRCSFCDYHTDFSLDEQANFQLNSKVLAQVTGEFGRLEVINSGSFCDLDDATMNLLLDLCVRAASASSRLSRRVSRISWFSIFSVAR